MKSKINIDTRTFVRFWLVIFGIALLAVLIYKAQTAFIILGISLFLALALNAPVSLLARKLPGKSRASATAIAYIAVILIIGAIITLVIPAIFQQTAKVAQNLPNVVETATQQWAGLKGFVDQYNLQSQLDSALQSIQSSTSSWAADVGKNIISGIGSFFSFIAALILVLVLTFLILIEGPRWLKKIWSMYTDQTKMKKHRHVVRRIYGVVSGYVTGQLTVSTIGAVAAGVVVFILSFIFHETDPNLALPTAAITFILSLIPMFGATIGGVIISLLLAFNSIPAAIVYAIYFVIYQQIENNFISPNIQAKRIDLTPLMVLAAVTIGLYMFGVVGGIIAIPIAGTIKVLIEEYLESRRLKQSSETTLDTPSVKLIDAKTSAKKEA